MIVPMKKVSIIVQSKDAAATIERLRSLGVLHVEHQIVPQSKDVNAVKEDIALVDRVLGILSKEEFSKAPVSEATGKIVDCCFSFTIQKVCSSYFDFKKYSFIII